MSSQRTYKKLGEIATIHDSLRKPVTKSDRKSGLYPYYGATGVQDYVDQYIFDGRYVLIGEDGAKWGANDKSAYIIEGKSWVNNHAHVLSFNDDICDSYVTYFLNYSDLDKYISGAIVRKLTQKSLLEISLPVPSLSEQQSIVRELDAISNIIAAKNTQLRELDALAQALFYDMFGDPASNPKGWDWKRIDSICENCDSKRKPVTSSNRVPGKIPYYGASGIVDYVKDYIFDGDYLLVSEDGANLLARTYPIAFPIFGKSWVNNHAHVLKFEHYATQLYVQTVLNLTDLSLILTGCIQPKFNQAKLNEFMVPLPPLDLQQAFAKKIEAIDAQKQTLRQSIAEFESLLAQRMDVHFG